ncbi:MAG: hypothetical protein ABJC09_04600 [Terriglobia bacterium]
MHFPKYWARGEWHGTRSSGESWRQLAWAGSDESQADAQTQADTKARRVGERAVRSESAQRDFYPYSDRQVREPVLRTLDQTADECAAVVTRTAYGSEVLNTARMMFVDIDLPPAKPGAGLVAAITRLFRGGSAPPAPSPTDARLASLRQWQSSNPSWAFRVYRTHSGFRYLVTSDWHDPLAGSTHTVLNSLGCDARYQKLCQIQKSFRARLTPKPWRCGCDHPPVRFPYEDTRQQALMQQWLAGYEQSSQGYATCQFLAAVGSTSTASGMASLIAEHDTRTKATSGLPLA